VDGLVRAGACDGCWRELSVGTWCLEVECVWSRTYWGLVYNVGVVDAVRVEVGLELR
jgi:hypothetical protein